jgi:hypothetical protein
MLNSLSSILNSIFPPEDIFKVIDSGDILKARKLLNNNPSLIEQINPDGYKPLTFAVSKKNKKLNDGEIKRMFIDKGGITGKK